MSFTAKIYKNTGYNAINSPDSPARLETHSYTSLDAAEVIQPYNLSKLVVSASYNQVEEADFLVLEGDGKKAFYSVDGFEMSSPDVAVLNISMMALLTYMAHENITSMADIPFLDGVTERHHIPSGSDNFGDYGEVDPLLVPSKPLEAVDSGDLLRDTRTADDHHIIESRLAVTAPGTEAITYEDSTTGEKVTVPNMKFTDYRGEVVIYDPGAGTTVTVKNPSAQYYDLDVPQVEDGVRRAQSLNLEGGILNSWCLPDDFIIKTVTLGTAKLTSKQREEAVTQLPFVYRSVHNKRALYGSTTRYILYSTASGSSAEFDAEDICKNGSSSLSYPTVVACYDPRPDGRPYFRTKYYRGESTNFWLNAIPGQQWASCPLNFTSKAGISLDTATFNTSRNISYQEGMNMVDMTNLKNQQRQFNADLAPVQKAFNEGGAVASAALSGNLFGLTQNALGMEMDYANTMYGIAASSLADSQAIQMKNMSLAQELQEFKTNTQFTIPDIKFPRSNTLRDILGNGVRMVRIQPSASDTSKFDKILNMYGYKITDPIQGSFFTNRSQYNYVKANGVSVGGTAPKWLRNAVSQELCIGCRYWHVNPNPSYYVGSSNN